MDDLPLVICRWRESWADHSQTQPSDWQDEYIVTTVGYLVRNDDELISLAQEIVGDGYRCISHIWKSSILDQSLGTPHPAPPYREGAGRRIILGEHGIQALGEPGPSSLTDIAWVDMLEMGWLEEMSE